MQKKINRVFNHGLAGLLGRAAGVEIAELGERGLELRDRPIMFGRWLRSHSPRARIKEEVDEVRLPAIKSPWL